MFAPYIQQQEKCTLLKIIGSILILASCYLIGNNLSRNAEITMKITESLISFTSYIGTSIKTLRIPLKNIYSNFENEDLTEIGFISELKELGLSKAVEKLEGILTQEGLNAMNYLNSNLGGIDINDQYNLCLHVENKLKVELENIKKKYKEKRRMYRLLPILCGISAIILLV